MTLLKHAPGKRTVTSALRICGLAAESHYQNYHRVLNRAARSPLEASRHWLGLLLQTFAPTWPLVFGLDDTIERRRGDKISAKGIYRDLVRSSHAHLVKASGLRWLCAMLTRSVMPRDRTKSSLECLWKLAPSARNV
jgi:hypothetical protein